MNYFTSEQKEAMKEIVKQFFYEERDEEIGDLAAHNALEFLMKELGPYFYNQGVMDAKIVVEQKVMNIEEDLSALERPIENR